MSPETLYPLTDLLLKAQQDPAFNGVLENIGKQHINISGLADPQKAYIAMAIRQACKNRPLVMILPDAMTARACAEALQALTDSPDDIRIWRNRDYAWTPMDASGRELEQQRIGILHDLVRGRLDILLIAAPGLVQLLPPPAAFRASLIHLGLGAEETPQGLADKLAALGYERASRAEAPGQFAKRGDIVDVVPVGLPENRFGGDASIGCRVSFYDTEVDLIRYFDCGTQRAIENITEISIPPAREVLIDELKRDSLARRVRRYGEQTVDRLKRDRAPAKTVRDLRALCERDADYIAEGRTFPGRDRWIDWIYDGKAATILDYVLKAWPSATSASAADPAASAPAADPATSISAADSAARAPAADPATSISAADPAASASAADLAASAPAAPGRRARPLIFLQEPARIRQKLDDHVAENIAQVRRYFEKGQSVEPAEQAFRNSTAPFVDLDQTGSVIALTTFAASGNGMPGGINIQIAGRDTESFRGKENQLVATLAKRAKLGATTVITTASEERRKKLRALFVDRGVYASLMAVDLPSGFEYPAAGLMILGTRDVFGTGQRRRRRRTKGEGQRIDLFSDLQPGDKVVHEIYGIGRYEGLVNMDDDGVRKDYLKIIYAGDDILYLPMKALDMLQKYVGASGREPKLSRLGGNDWNRLKDRARAGIKKLATNLVDLYAKRRNLKGFVFPEDSPWEREFAQSFPYEETDDQLRCIEEINADMASDKVMDRLLCGDVGFGKTEVAFRAIFKCITAGKQAALLAPTTVLAQQHYENFVDRVGDFPVNIGLLSRFAKPEEARRVIKGLRTGEVDVVIGTHRLLSNDVHYKDLGLLVVDEEQRFGVDHKEKLKNITPTVDVLTLSATPIPRTLHMSMSGIRDISIIEEPPEDRRAVQTFVLEYDEAIIQAGIERELEREGQVFYLFNDTRRIHDKMDQLQEMFPTARIAVAHGKMHEAQLEAVVESFLLGDIDIMVCTTIIESGIDMPNVNTIVVENADRFGLAQLYQLRGRVGRSGRQAYAYITYRREKVLNEDAEKRLAAIRDYTELGSGFKVALKDLEVRGAGNLLGGEQHGQLDAIGYDLYCKMLEEEIQKARAEELRKEKLAPEQVAAERAAGEQAATGQLAGQLAEADPASETGSAGRSSGGRSIAARQVRKVGSAVGTAGAASVLATGAASSATGATSSATGATSRTSSSRSSTADPASERPVQTVSRQTAFPELFAEDKSMETHVDIKTDAYLSPEYIPDDGERIDIYRRISLIRSSADYNDLIDELTDRYGDLPSEVTTLADFSYIRAQANRCGFKKVSLKDGSVILPFGRNDPSDMEHVAVLMSLPKYKERVRFNATDSAPFIQVYNIGTNLKTAPAKLRDLFMAIEREEGRTA